MIVLHENATHLTVVGKPREIEFLREAFRFQPDGYFHALSYQRYRVSEGQEGWDGYIYPFFKIGETTAKVLRGRKEEVIQHARLEGFKLDLTHLLEYPFADLEIDDVRPDLVQGKHELDINQRQGILDWLRAGIGFNKMTVGGGKTLMFGGAAALIKERFPEARFLYLTPSERLVRQSTSDLRTALPHFEIGQCGGGHHDWDAKDMVVCTVAMLSKHYGRLLTEEWFDTFMAVLYDEVHHAGSDTSKKVLMAVPAYFRLGASDTDKEANPTRFNDIKGLFGPMLNDVPSAPLIESGRLAKPHIYVVDVPAWIGRFSNIPYRPLIGSQAYVLLDGEWTPGTYSGPVYELDEAGNAKTRTVKTAEKDEDDEWIMVQEPIIVPGLHLISIKGIDHEVESKWCLLDRMTDRSIIQFKPRNEIIVAWVKYFHQQGWPTVVVATRTAYVYILQTLISAEIGKSNVEILMGKHSPGTRDDVFEWFKETPGAVIVTPLIKEGVSINEIQAMVVADHVGDYEVARQIIGRSIRPKKKGLDNRAHVVWFWDKQHITLRRSSAQVLQALERTDGYSYFHPCAGPETVFEPDLFGQTRAANPRPSSRAARRR